jgi:hypothetical protein
MKKRQYKLTIDKSAFSIGNLTDIDNERKAYWANRTHLERLEAVEILRQQLHNYDPATARLQRVFEVSKLTSD